MWVVLSDASQPSTSVLCLSNPFARSTQLAPAYGKGHPALVRGLAGFMVWRTSSMKNASRHMYFFSLTENGSASPRDPISNGHGPDACMMLMQLQTLVPCASHAQADRPADDMKRMRLQVDLQNDVKHMHGALSNCTASPVVWSFWSLLLLPKQKACAAHAFTIHG